MRDRSFFYQPTAVCLTIMTAIGLGSCASKPSNPQGAPKATPTPKSTPVQTGASKSTPAKQTSSQPRKVVVHQEVIEVGTPATSYNNFSEWKRAFIGKGSANHSAGRAEEMFGGASLNDRVIDLDGGQAEFAKMPWEYLDSAVSSSRVSQGQQKRRDHLSLLNRNEEHYGVPASVVTAIWGIESSYGAGMGNIDLIDALSSLAYDGRRQAFAESQLLAMMDLVERGDVASHQLQGSWAGGMGHTQFIPTTWLEQGVDGDNDGRRNPFSVADALTSTANYLANAGWVRGLPAYIEVRLPEGFDYRTLGQKLSLDTWRSMGVSSVAGDALNSGELAELWLPAGKNGPALLTTKNFEVIKVYNNSSNYALAVATLANRINGRVGISASFPRHERSLSRYQVQRLQQNLTNQGYDTKGTDGVVGSNTRRAFAAWQAANGQVPDGFISQNSAGHLAY